MLRACVLLFAGMASFCGLSMATVTLSKTLITPSPGKTNSVTCTVSDGERFIGWFDPAGKKVPTSSSEKIYVETTGNNHKLKLTDVKVSYGGTYTCKGTTNSESLKVHVEFDTSDVDLEQHIQIDKEGTIRLGVTGFPTPIFTWKKGSKRVGPNVNSRYSIEDDGSLKISKVEKSDGGNYTCAIEQDGTEDDVIIEVYAVELPKIKPFTQTKRYLTEGYPVTFLCEATGYPLPKYKWFSPKDVELSEFGNIKIQDGNLTFTKVDSAFEKGKYKCEAYIEIGKNQEQVGRAEAFVEVVEVYVEPNINPTQGGTVDVKMSGDYKLTCIATGTPTPDVRWTRNGEKDPREQQTRGQSMIEFRRIQVEDGGVYTCEAWNSAEDQDGNLIVKRLNKTINVESKPIFDEKASINPVFSYVGNSDPTYVRCKYEGYPTPWVVMTFDGKLKSNATGTAEMEVITDAIKYFGDYKCYARNKFGWTNRTVTMETAKKPSQVQGLKPVPTCNSIKLTWKAPSENGGMPINKYVLNYETTTRNVDGDSTTYTIKNLERNTRYSIKVRATNKAEWGDMSVVETKTTQFCAPGRPIIYSPKGGLLEEDEFTLKWRRPEDDGGDSNIKYKLEYRVERKGSDGPWKTIETEKEEAKISQMDNQETYKFVLVAINKGGESEKVIKYYNTNYPEETSSQSSLVPRAFLTICLGGMYLLL